MRTPEEIRRDYDNETIEQLTHTMRNFIEMIEGYGKTSIHEEYETLCRCADDMTNAAHELSVVAEITRDKAQKLFAKLIRHENN